ncbi:MAG: cholesterol oxidase [Sphingomonadales bacterium]|nr:cholesterol oxidase [Sphingomonadales bacterium]
MDFDAIVIGSGFGGAVSACRLAEAGARTLVLERGRRWDKTNYPLHSGDWLWDQHDPVGNNGWLDLRLFRHMAVAQGAAVGGGSHIYANISAVPPRDTFDAGWPPEITWDALAPHYDTVGQVMNVQTIPDGQWTNRMKLMKEAADRIGAGDRFRKLELAVSFDPGFHYDLEDPVNLRHSRRFVNAQGVEQGTCVHLANCDIGCDADAKNTLDRNYLALAERKGAEIRPLHLVRTIEREGTGYRVHFDGIGKGERRPGSATAERVIVAAGSLGSTELLLRCRDVARTLPDISPFLGRNWSSNGDFLTPSWHGDRRPEPSIGPTISSAIDFLDRSDSNQSYWIQDGGFPNFLEGWIRDGEASHARIRALMIVLRKALAHGPTDHVMPWFAQGVDAADGRLSLRRRWWLFGQHQLTLSWQIAKSQKLIDAIVAMHRKLAVAAGGTPMVPFTWTRLKYLITPHPLGGCNMGTAPENGVVDHLGRVFGYPNLHVLDGAIVPEAVGVNPSRTIAALAERTMAEIAKG